MKHDRGRLEWYAIAAALLGVVALTVLPLVLSRNLGAHHDAVVSRVLAIEALDRGLGIETMRLRLGLAKDYDAVARTMESLERETRSLRDELRESPAPEDRYLFGELQGFLGGLERKREIAQRFPTYNATLLNSLHALPVLYESVVERGEDYARSAGWSLDEVERLYRDTLALHVSWQPSVAADRLAELRGRVTDQPAYESPLEALVRHVLLTLERRLQTDDLIAELDRLSRNDLSASIEAYVREGDAAGAAAQHRASVLQLSCYLLAVAVCAGIGLIGFRQSRALRHEVAEGARLHREAQEYEARLRQAQKMESIGQLAAGVAHEINTPTQFIGDNASFLQESFGDVLAALGRIREVVAGAGGEAQADELARTIEKALEEADIEFLAEEIPRALAQSIDGVGRVSRIVRALKDYSHPGAEGATYVDLGQAIESTVTVATNEWKYVADMDLHLDPDLPEVCCLPGELNQVILNMIVNAAHAIADVLGEESASKGTIRISTERIGDQAEIRIADTGAGIEPENLERIFDPFFTTKEIGKGTGQGLSIAYDVVVNKHRGTIDVESVPGRGTTFVIRLPLDREPEVRDAA